MPGQTLRNEGCTFSQLNLTNCSLEGVDSGHQSIGDTNVSNSCCQKKFQPRRPHNHHQGYHHFQWKFVILYTSTPQNISTKKWLQKILSACKDTYFWRQIRARTHTFLACYIISPFLLSLGRNNEKCFCLLSYCVHLCD